MAKRKEHEEALRLRRLGWSYSAIKKKIEVSKSSLSLWLRDYPLTKEQIYKLQHNEVVAEKFRETMKKKREKAFSDALNIQNAEIGSLSKRELYLVGLALYWGEGGKTKYSELTFANTDPRMIKFYLKWLMSSLGFPKEKIRIRLHLYKDMIIDDEVRYWMNVTGLEKSHFVNPYIKDSYYSKLSRMSWGHGTCNVISGGVKYARPVFAGMEVLSRMY